MPRAYFLRSVVCFSAIVLSFASCAQDDDPDVTRGSDDAQVGFDARVNFDSSFDQDAALSDASWQDGYDAAIYGEDATAFEDAATEDAEVPDDGEDPPAMRDPVELLVYSNNIENLPEPGDPCPGDWRDFYQYMKLKNHVPDLLVFQQVSNRTQLDFIVDQLRKTTGKTYDGVIGEANPTAFSSPCKAPKRLQTNAIIYRKDRFETRGAKVVYKSYANYSGSCVRANNSRNRTLIQKLRHKATGAVIAVAAIRWPTAQGGGSDPACAVANVRETNERLEKLAPNADLYVIAGDANESDLNSSGGFRRWFDLVNGDRGGNLSYRDAIYQFCRKRDALKKCLDNNWTGGAGKRIDFTFYRAANKKLPRVLASHTVTYDEADAADRKLSGSDHPANYSQHRAIVSRVRF